MKEIEGEGRRRKGEEEHRRRGERRKGGRRREKTGGKAGEGKGVREGEGRRPKYGVLWPLESERDCREEREARGRCGERMDESRRGSGG